MIYAHIKTRLEATHQWKECDIKEVDFLKYRHHHEFEISVKIQENHTNRDIEFIAFKRWLDSELIKLRDRNYDLKNLSCESLCEKTREIILKKYPGREVIVEVLEDGHYGSIVDYAREAAWLAGIIDGEGYIGLCKQLKGVGNFYPKIDITNTNLEMIEKIQAIYKKLVIDKEIKKYNKGKFHKQVYNVGLTKKESIIELLNIVKDFLIAKKEQATLLQEWCEIRTKNPITTSKRDGLKKRNCYDRELQIYEKLKELNKRGPI